MKNIYTSIIHKHYGPKQKPPGHTCQYVSVSQQLIYSRKD
jgi:hypothetical protein